MNPYLEINRNPSRRELFAFGLIFAAGTGIMGLVFEYHLHRSGPAQGLWIAGAAVFLLSFLRPVGRLLYILWMGLGVTIGLFTSPVIMGLLYAIVIVPVGIVFRIRRRDLMRRKLDPAAASYWEDYPEGRGASSYIRQY